MSNPIQYGRQETKEVYANGQKVKSVITYTEVVRVGSEANVITEFLKIMDQHKSGQVEFVGLKLISGKGGESSRVEKTWTVPDLQ